ncbi:kunitz/Bovine pancreatic trypsin inhibitor domain-containing protein [Ditylenchus destructor]|uniref:Kunitz/Bovine pancreatic trypsin inhibitor domain-containing protein n=1 Tax=Ditylenchus destructor TaxID=166010 RepID=A0AAD4NDA1_9BILA|nr:kunitz/Bovine pancreatic trypsin inhibitor domain-containing protein [Ditylenchus destructor]
MSLLFVVATGLKSKTVDICDYYRAIEKLREHPECMRDSDIETSTEKPELPSCSAQAALVQCTAESDECPESGQLCTQSDGSNCCQEAVQGIPVSHINAKAGNCPQPIGISTLQDGSTGCWLDSNCPGIQKCCLEPNTISRTARRICRDPFGISGESVCNLPLAVGTCTAPTTRYYFDASSGKCKAFQYSGCGGNANNFQSMASCQATCGFLGVQGTPSCPSDANSDLNCLLPHGDACHTDSDCLGRENTVQPSCCMTKCGYRICYLL